MKKPLYPNECPSCVYLGAFQEKDLYICNKNILVVRSSSGNSGIPLEYYKLSPYAWEAYDRAKKLKLIKTEEPKKKG